MYKRETPLVQVLSVDIGSTLSLNCKQRDVVTRGGTSYNEQYEEATP